MSEIRLAPLINYLPPHATIAERGTELGAVNYLLFLSLTSLLTFSPKATKGAHYLVLFCFFISAGPSREAQNAARRREKEECCSSFGPTSGPKLKKVSHFLVGGNVELPG
jgi:hypothetical protein